MPTQDIPLPRIAYCGPIAAPGTPARGGFESANRRLIDDLRQAGLAVAELAYASERRSTMGKALAYGASFATLTARVAATAHRWDVFHITPLRRHFAPAEAVLCRIAKRRGNKVVVDLRAGDLAANLSEDARPFERRALVAMLRMADLVAVEGTDYLPLVAPWGAATLYVPNYVAPPPGRPATMRDPTDVHLVFLGRVVAEKGIEIAIEALGMLNGRGMPARLSVIGKATAAYESELRARSTGLPVSWIGPLPHGDVAGAVEGASYFLFPTVHDGEGHSNALTEAMAAGLVPVVSDNGFNRAVVGGAGIVLPVTASAGDYAEVIERVERTGEWRRLSNAARHRVGTHFSRDRVVPPLVDAYTRLISPVADQAPRELGDRVAPHPMA